jgi:hypothetical protein
MLSDVIIIIITRATEGGGGINKKWQDELTR